MEAISAAGTAVSGDVGDEEAGLGFAGDEEVVEVSGDGGHGDVAGGDAEVRGLRIGGGEGWRSGCGVRSRVLFGFR